MSAQTVSFPDIDYGCGSAHLRVGLYAQPSLRSALSSAPSGNVAIVASEPGIGMLVRLQSKPDRVEIMQVLPPPPGSGSMNPSSCSNGRGSFLAAASPRGNIVAIVYECTLKFYVPSSSSATSSSAPPYYSLSDECTLYFKITDVAISCAVADDGQRGGGGAQYFVAAAGANGVEIVKLIDDGFGGVTLSKDDAVWPVCLAQTFHICSVSFSKSGDHLSMATTDGRVGVWSTASISRIESPSAIWKTSLREGRITRGVLFAQKNSSALCLGCVTWDGVLHVYKNISSSDADPLSFQLAAMVHSENESNIAVQPDQARMRAPGLVAFSPDGTRAAISHGNIPNAISVVDIEGDDGPKAVRLVRIAEKKTTSPVWAVGLASISEHVIVYDSAGTLHSFAWESIQ